MKGNQSGGENPEAGLEKPQVIIQGNGLLWLPDSEIPIMSWMNSTHGCMTVDECAYLRLQSCLIFYMWGKR